MQLYGLHIQEAAPACAFVGRRAPVRDAFVRHAYVCTLTRVCIVWTRDRQCLSEYTFTQVAMCMSVYGVFVWGEGCVCVFV